MNVNNSGNEHRIGQYMGSGQANFLDGYLAETVLVDGLALTPSSFGVLDASNTWQPLEYNGAYGTNGFRMQYANSGALGTDTSGNANNYTTSGLTTTNQVSDVPNDNFCVLNPVDTAHNGTISKGNLVFTVTASPPELSVGSITIPLSGKWYAEVTLTNVVGTCFVGVTGITRSGEDFVSKTDGIAYRTNGQIDKNGSLVQGSLATATTSDIISISGDASANTVQFRKNNSVLGTTES